MNVGSLFSGIGGIELGFERAGGFRTKWFVEWDAYAQAVLRKHWPEIPVYGDIKDIDWGAVTPIDVLTGGFPCQPHSFAGKRRASADDRDLWPECRRAIATLKPRVCCFENVPGLLTSEKGAFFKRIIDDFYHLGYRPRVYRLSARDVGAPHLRKRVFIVAYRDNRQCLEQNEAIRAGLPPVGGSSAHVANSNESRLQGWERTELSECASERPVREGCSLADSSGERCAEAWGDSERSEERPACGGEVADANVSGLEGRGEYRQCACERAPWACCRAHEDTRLARSGIRRVSHGVLNRAHRLKCLGNAVVPQCAEVIARIIKEEMKRIA